MDELLLIKLLKKTTVELNDFIKDLENIVAEKRNFESERYTDELKADEKRINIE